MRNNPAEDVGNGECGLLRSQIANDFLARAFFQNRFDQSGLLLIEGLELVIDSGGMSGGYVAQLGVVNLEEIPVLVETPGWSN